MRRFADYFAVIAVLGALLAVLMLPVIAGGSRICFGPGSVRAAVFMDPDRIEVYTIDGRDRGELQFSYSQSYLVTLPPRPAQDLLLGVSDVNIHVELWRTSGGLYKVLAGPDGENKMHECIFGGSSARVRTYFYAGEALAAEGEFTDPQTTAPATLKPGDPTSSAPTDVPATPTDSPQPPTPVSTEEALFRG